MIQGPFLVGVSLPLPLPVSMSLPFTTCYDGRIDTLSLFTYYQSLE